MHISMRYMNRIWKNYREIGKRTLREKGPKPHQITDAEIQAVMEARQRHPNAGAIAIEQYLLDNGLSISHNRGGTGP